MDYKADITLNEKDALTDMLTAEKNLVKTYSEVMTESCSKGFRTLVKNHWSDAVSDQTDVFLMLTEHDYYRVETAPAEETEKVKEKFAEVRGQMS